MTSPVSPELSSKISDWRLRCAEGTMTEAEMLEAVKYLRAGRVAAAQSSTATKRKAAIKAIPNAADLLDEIE